MKKTLILFFAASLSCLAFGQVQKQKVMTSEVRTAPSKAENFSEITFDTLRYNFGKFSKKDPVVKCSFKFKNTGTAPLIIHQAFASCGCTVPTYTKAPVKAGETGTIDVTYNGTDRMPGHFQKTITIRTNAINEIVRLTIEGTME